jgi:hypothetical protein
MITAIKALHTAIWAVMAAATVYILYSGIIGIVNSLFWICLALMLIEVAVLIINRWSCPLTNVAMKHTDERGHNFDIFLPNWLAKHNKAIFGTMLFAGLALHLLRLIS